MDAQDALKQSKTMPPQTRVDIMRGLSVKRNQGGIPIVRVHYSANPERDPEINPGWKKAERAKYSSDAAWRREQEIEYEAGGGELVFADVMVTYWDKIIISDPKWRPSPHWRCEAGFDHGRTNPTCLERMYIDYDGVRIFCGEYYQPGMEIWQHAAKLKQMEHINRLSAAHADPSIFDITQQQSGSGKAQERAKSINELYVEQGIELFSPFMGDRSDISFAARVMLHWADLGNREPTLKIVCPNYSDKPQPGLHQWSCPNLVWELMRTRRVKLTAQQLQTRNPSEAIVDRDNHARDAAKYVELSHPEPTVKTMQEIAAAAVQGLDATSAMIRYQQKMEELDRGNAPVALGRRGLMRRR